MTNYKKFSKFNKKKRKRKHMIETLSITTAFMIGLLGSTHCVGMCGGIASTLSLALPQQQLSPLRRYLYLLCYHFGRIGSYALIGVIAGMIGVTMAHLLGDGARLFLKNLGGVLLIVLGLYLTGWWKILSHLEKVGLYLWKYISPITQRLIPVVSVRKALFLGMLWGWLPCGLVYSTLALALSSGSWQTGGLLMLSFGLGTTPVLLLLGIFAHSLIKFTQSPLTRLLAGIAVMGFGMATIYLLNFTGSHHMH
jgi:sulfite exporter TauE/SafE